MTVRHGTGLEYHGLGILCSILGWELWCQGLELSSRLAGALYLCKLYRVAEPSARVLLQKKSISSQGLWLSEKLFPSSLLRLYWCEWSCWTAHSFFIVVTTNVFSQRLMKCKAEMEAQVPGWWVLVTVRIYLQPSLCWYNCTAWNSGDNWDTSFVFFTYRPLHDSTPATFLQA